MAEYGKTHFMAKAMGYDMVEQARQVDYGSAVTPVAPVPTTGLVETNLVTVPEVTPEGDSGEPVDEDKKIVENDGQSDEENSDESEQDEN